MSDKTVKVDFSGKNIGFIGAGNMAKAIGSSIINSGLVDASQVMVSAPSHRNLASWEEKGVKVTTVNSDIVSNCDIVFLAMKPQFLEEALLSLKEVKKLKARLFISVLLGVTISSIYKKITWPCVEVIRVMPNTPIAVGAGCTFLCHHPNTTCSSVNSSVTLMSAGGMCQIVPETLIDPLGGISGSGPAYLYLIAEALSDGGVKVGVPRDLAVKTVAHTMLGAAKMILNGCKHTSELKDNVCSPGGSTIAALHVIEHASVRGTLISAVEAAHKRAQEMQKQYK